MKTFVLQRGKIAFVAYKWDLRDNNKSYDYDIESDIESDTSLIWPHDHLRDRGREVVNEMSFTTSEIVRRYNTRDRGELLFLLRCPPNREGVQYYLVFEKDLIMEDT